MNTQEWIEIGILTVGILSFVAYVWFEVRKRRMTSSSVAVKSSGGPAVAGSGNVVIGSIFLGQAKPSSTHQSPGPCPNENGSEKPSTMTRSEESSTRRDTHVCPSGPYDISPGTPRKIELDVKPGEAIRGKLDGDRDFDYDIVDERNYVLLRRREDFVSVISGEGEVAYSVRWKVPRKGPWFLVLSAPRRSNERRVSVFLRGESHE